MEKNDNKVGNLISWIKKHRGGRKDEASPDDDMKTHDISDNENAPPEQAKAEEELLVDKAESVPDEQTEAGEEPFVDMAEGSPEQETNDEIVPDSVTNVVEDSAEVEAMPQAEVQPADGKLPQGVYALFLLVDINACVKDIKGIPRYYHIKRTKTLIGRHFKSSINLDDKETIEVEHARLLYAADGDDGKKGFVVCPVNDARVLVNDKVVPGNGVPLKNGDSVKIGSASLIFFYKDLARD